MAEGTGDAAAGPDDAGLVARIAAGDRDAEACFVARYGRGVRMLVRRHCRPRDPAVDDLAQDVLTDVIERLRAGGLRDGAALPAYVRSAVVHATSADYRRRRSSVPLDEDLVAPEDPAATLQREQVRTELARGIETLGTPRDRDVLVRFYLREQDKDEICAALGIDESHFRRVLFRARERLRERLQAAGLEYAW